MNLVKNTIYNILGLGLPLVIAFFSIPVLIEELGDARFGILTLIWAVVSYFGLFDLGLGRALTQQLAIALNSDQRNNAGPLIATSLFLMTFLGITAGVLMAAAAYWGVGLMKAVPNQQETVNAVFAMALAMPAIILTTGFRGILEARHAFGIINLIRLPMGLFTFLGPLAVVVYGQPRLDAIALTLTIGRIVGCIIHSVCAWNALPIDCKNLRARKELIRPLCISGGWLTISNIISPLMGYIDRFLIGGIVSTAAVAYYSAPQEMVTKLWILPGALTAVLFPTFAEQIAKRDLNTRIVFEKAVNWLFLAIFPITLTLALFSFEVIEYWISRDFAYNSALLLQIFCFGILINCLAHVPFTLIQGSGEPRLTAIVHTAELPIFLIALWWLTSAYGVIGAAIAWLLRMTFDTIIMFLLCYSRQNWPINRLINFNIMLVILLTTISFTGILISSLSLRATWLISILAITSLATLYFSSKNKLHQI